MLRLAVSLYEAVFLTPSSMALALFLLAATSLATWRLWPGMANTATRHKEARLAFFTILSTGLLDWALLLALPRLGLSYGPINSSLAAILLLRLGSLGLILCTGLAWKAVQRRRAAAISTARVSPFFLFLLALNLGILAAEIYGLVYEPFNLGTSQLAIESPAFLPDRPLRIVHLTDIHVERITKRELAMLAAVHELQPDLIVLTGDYLNYDYKDDPLAQRDAAQVLSQLSAPYGVYAELASSTDDLQRLQQFESQLDNITVLRNEVQRIDFPGQPLYIIGVTATRGIPLASATLHDLAAQIPENAYSLLLYHKPDLAYAAAQEKVDLYLAGHTHGGQIRLPFYGAVITFSAFGKQFEMGRYQIEQTTLYVSRGIGMEGLQLPRIRFLCPPEIVLVNLGAEEQP